MIWLWSGLTCASLSILVGVFCYSLGYVIGGRDEARALAETLRGDREDIECAFGNSP